MRRSPINRLKTSDRKPQTEKELAVKWLQCLALIVLMAGCSKTSDSVPRSNPAKETGDVQTLTLATTTSTRDSGLLDVLVPLFHEQTGIDMKVIAVGSGQALELGRRGDADVLLTHAPAAEEQFMAQGHGETRRNVMHNDFVLVGPPDDPARIKGQTAISDAFHALAKRAAPFVSRGDESGTHMKEKAIWNRSKIATEGEWYIQAGAGMAEVLRMASEKQAYTLTDRSTFLAQRERLDLVIVSEGDDLLRNDYAVIVVSPQQHPGVNHAAAQRFAEFLLSPQGQQAIGNFGIDKFGQPLFFPDALPTAAGHGIGQCDSRRVNESIDLPSNCSAKQNTSFSMAYGRTAYQEIGVRIDSQGDECLVCRVLPAVLLSVVDDYHRLGQRRASP